MPMGAPPMGYGQPPHMPPQHGYPPYAAPAPGYGAAPPAMGYGTVPQYGAPPAPGYDSYGNPVPVPEGGWKDEKGRQHHHREQKYKQSKRKANRKGGGITWADPTLDEWPKGMLNNGWTLLSSMENLSRTMHLISTFRAALLT